MPKAFPKESHEDVIRVFRSSGSSMAKVAKDSGVSPDSRPFNWPGSAATQSWPPTLTFAGQVAAERNYWLLTPRTPGSPTGATGPVFSPNDVRVHSSPPSTPSLPLAKCCWTNGSAT